MSSLTTAPTNTETVSQPSLIARPVEVRIQSPESEAAAITVRAWYRAALPAHPWIWLAAFVVASVASQV